MFNHNGYRAGATGAHAGQKRPAAGVWGPADSAGPAVGAGPRRMLRPRSSPAQCTRRNATSRHQTFDIPSWIPAAAQRTRCHARPTRELNAAGRGPRSPDGESSSAVSTRSATSTVTRPPRRAAATRRRSLRCRRLGGTVSRRRLRWCQLGTTEDRGVQSPGCSRGAGTATWSACGPAQTSPENASFMMSAVIGSTCSALTT